LIWLAKETWYEFTTVAGANVKILNGIGSIFKSSYNPFIARSMLQCQTYMHLTHHMHPLESRMLEWVKKFYDVNCVRSFEI